MLRRFGAPHLLVAATLLIGGGWVMLYSASAVRSQLGFGSSYALLLRQLGAAAIGGVALLCLARLPLRWLERLAYVAWAIAVTGIAATYGPAGVEVNGARRWLSAGGLSFQPLEPAKLGVLLAVACWLSSQRDRLDDVRFSLLVPGVLTGLPAALLLGQPDYGGAAVLLINTGVLVFAAGARLGHLAMLAAVAAPLAVGLALASPYRLRRLEVFLNPWADPLGGGYQLVQSQLAYGAGGWGGVGLGAGEQKLFYLPEAHTDFILSVIAEETGLIGVAGVLICYGVIALASLGIAARAASGFATLLALGAGLLLWLQAGLNAGVSMAVLPPKGTTLPLVSYGGSSLVTSLAAVGLLLAVARPRLSGRPGWR